MGKKVLVIDDEAELAQMLAEFLAEEGHQVDVSLNYNDALNKAMLNKYDAIVCDYSLDFKSGAQFYSEIGDKQKGALKFLMSGYIEIPAVEGIMFLEKPINIEKLISKIQEG